MKNFLIAIILGKADPRITTVSVYSGKFKHVTSKAQPRFPQISEENYLSDKFCVVVVFKIIE